MKIYIDDTLVIHNKVISEDLFVGNVVKISNDFTAFWVKIVIKHPNNTQYIGVICDSIEGDHSYNKNDYIRFKIGNIIKCGDSQIQTQKWLDKNG